ncbi:MAG: alpha-L-fucosidase [Panacibacter sp.]
MKNVYLFLFFVFAVLFSNAQDNYSPAPENLKARQWFADAKFGLFIHWGPFSIPGSGEWVMNERNITVKNYTRLMDFFNPIEFDAAKWVSMAKDAGMKYITLITRHHDGFSMWDTKYSDFNIMNSPYHKDIVKMMADECHKQGIKLFLYYSLLDWRRDDYSWTTGRTGKGTGRTVQGNWNDYISFMKNQLTELLTNYGEIGGIWFDGHWDQTAPEGATDRTPRVDWHYDEIYGLIHKLQPQCMIGNNHHLSPLPGEDFQMFEKDLPGENKSGLSYQEASDKLPVETCETINNSWGFNITDTTYKTHEQLLQYLVKGAGLGVNFLLNIGPMPNGEIQPEFIERLHWMGEWLRIYGESIYNTKGGYLPLQTWGCLTQKEGKVYVHVLDKQRASVILEQFPFKRIAKAYLLKDKTSVKTQLKNGMAQLFLPENINEPDEVIVLEVKG